MDWDLGLRGVGLLIGMSLVFGLVVQLVVGRALGRWLWLGAAAAYFVAGVVVSEVFFGWATGEDLQPNVDGLSVDEVHLATLVGLVAAFVTRHLTRKPGEHVREHVREHHWAGRHRVGQHR